MRIAVIGSGAIGCLVAGYLKFNGEDVILVARPEAAKVINSDGLRITGVRGAQLVRVAAFDTSIPHPDLVILATKIQDIEAAIKQHLNHIKNSIILTTENGIRADDIVAKFVPKDNILSSIVMFGATNLKNGEVVHNFEGSWIIGSMFGKHSQNAGIVANHLNKAFPTVVSEDIKGMKYTKVFVNSNNCIPGILGLSMQESFSDLEISRISINIWKEGLGVVNKAGVKLVSLPDFPVERITKLANMPSVEAAKIYAGIMGNLSKEPLYGSILQSIKRGKKSEIDYINGEFVNLAEENGLNAPLNKKLVGMVHQVEKNGKFFSHEDFISQVRGLIH